MLVINDGENPNPKRGDYNAKVCRKGSFEYEGWDEVKTTRTGRVEDYPSKSYNVWRLVVRALKACFPEES